MIEMAKQDIYPALNGYIAEICSVVAAKRAVSEKIACEKDVALAERLARDNEAMMNAVEKLETDLLEMPEGNGPASQKMAHVIVPDMEEVRRCADGMERLCASGYWPFPVYTDLMYSVK